jgi:hypothetical protein
VLGLVTGGICLWTFSASVARPGGSVLSSLVMLSLASLTVGGLIGFLFGIPRALQDGHGARGPADPGDGSAPRTAGTPYQANTNLEQISDWLTKILVGVGLVQIGSLPSTAGRFVSTITADLDIAQGNSGGRVIVGCLLVANLIGGFLISYLLTRLLLTGAFTRADMAAVREIAVAAAHEQAEVQQQRDEVALGLVARQLDPPPGSTEIPAERLTNAIVMASPAVRSQIFTVARGVRASNTGRDPAVMARTIPVFRALIVADPRHHRNHGQLGYALKEKHFPDLDAAEQELSEAIRLRDASDEPGWLYYELNRAVAQIARLGSAEPTPEARRSILDDIRAARGSRTTAKALVDDESVQCWLRRWAPQEVELDATDLDTTDLDTTDLDTTADAAEPAPG